jgi:hypothetical protein
MMVTFLRAGISSPLLGSKGQKTYRATGFSQWLMTNFISAEFIWRKILEGSSPDEPKIFGSA